MEIIHFFWRILHVLWTYAPEFEPSKLWITGTSWRFPHSIEKFSSKNRCHLLIRPLISDYGIDCLTTAIQPALSNNDPKSAIISRPTACKGRIFIHRLNYRERLCFTSKRRYCWGASNVSQQKKNLENEPQYYYHYVITVNISELLFSTGE